VYIGLKKSWIRKFADVVCYNRQNGAETRNKKRGPALAISTAPGSWPQRKNERKSRNAVYEAVT